jgi:hypothetical protein
MKEQKRIWGELFCVSLFFLFVIFGITTFLGTINSGWHFVDDHEFLEFKYYLEIEHYTVWDLLKQYVIMDRSTRNNSLYYPTRIVLYYIAGIDLVKYEIIKAIECVVALVLLYFCGKKITGSTVVSAFFSLTCLIGYHSPLLWKLGPEHIQALICFGIAFLSLLCWLEDITKKHYAVISFIFAVLMGYFHESFFLMMPFLAFYVFYDGYRYKSNPIKGKLYYCVSVLAAFLLLMLRIIIRLGINSYSDVGFASGRSPLSYVKTVIMSLNYHIKWYWIFGICLMCVLLTFYDKFKENLIDIAISATIVLPQVVLYSKEGLSERYLVPAVVGYALFFIVLVYKENYLSGKRKMLYLFFLIAMFICNAHAMVVEGDYYRFRGQGVTNALEIADEMSSKGYNVLSCFGNANPEADWTVEMYLKSQGKPDVYYWCQHEGKIYDNRHFKSDGTGGTLDVSDMDVIMAYNRDDRHFEIDPNIDFSDYTCIRSAGIDIYFGNNAGKEVTEDLMQRLRVKPTIYGIGK